MANLVIMSAGMKADLVLGIPVESILVNVPDVEKSYETYHRLIDALKPQYRMLDSGGYQILTAEEEGKRISFDEHKPLINSAGELNLTPNHVVEVAARINPDIVVAQDFPILKITGESGQRKEFFKKFPFNRKWAIRTSELMVQRGMDLNKLFMPVQCYTIQQFEIFHRHISGCAFGGMSMPVRNLKLNEVLRFWLKMYEYGITRVHLLGTTAAKAITLAAYMARQHFFEWVSLDSTTWMLAANNKQYLASEDLKGLRVGDEKLISPTRRKTCNCLWCSDFTDFAGIINMDSRSKSRFLARHNFMATQNFARNAYVRAGSAANLEEFINNNFTNDRIARETVSAIREAAQYRRTRAISNGTNRIIQVA
ncbi:MAG: hypothetical protein ABSH41_31285 [Syntrophobacteraceae bacterium]